MILRHFLPFVLIAFSYSVIASPEKIDELLDDAWAQYESSPQNCIKLIDQAISLAQSEELKDKELEALEMKGIIYDELDFTNKAVDIYLDVLKEHEASNNLSGVSSVYNNLGISFFKAGNLEEAAKYYEKSLLIDRQLDQSGVNSLYNLASIYSKTGKYDRAIDLFNEVLDLSDINKTDSCSTLIGLGLVHQRATNYSLAVEYYEQAKELVENDLNKTYAVLLSNLGKSQFKNGNFKEAEKCLLESEAMLEEIGNSTSRLQVLESLALIYESKDNLPAAISFRKKHSSLQDSLEKINDLKYLSTVTTIYELDKSQEEVKKLQIEKEKSKKENWRIAALGISIISVLSLAFVTSRYRLSKNKRLNQIQKLKIEHQTSELKRYKSELDIKTKSLLDRNRRILALQKESESKQESSTLDDSIDEVLRSKILTTQDWDNYKRAYSLVYPNFFSQLEGLEVELTQGEQRTAALNKLGLGNVEIAEILGISERSVIQNKYRLRKKLDLKDNEALNSYLQHI